MSWSGVIVVGNPNAGLEWIGFGQRVWSFLMTLLYHPTLHRGTMIVPCKLPYAAYRMHTTLHSTPHTFILSTDATKSTRLINLTWKFCCLETLDEFQHIYYFIVMRSILKISYFGLTTMLCE